MSYPVSTFRCSIPYPARVTAWIVLFFLHACMPASADNNAWTVQKLNDNKPWDRFIESPLSIRVEGRIGTFGATGQGGGQFRLLHCDAKFVVDNAKLKQVHPKSVVEVRGRFKKEGAKIEFAVDDLKVMPGYLEQYSVRASKLKRPAPEEWIELGDWMAERARFYDDSELTEKANEAYMNAIEVEYKSLKGTDAETRFTLAKKIDHYKLSSRRKMELLHEGLRIQWQALEKANPTNPRDQQALVATIEQQLPGAGQALKSPIADLKEKYEHDPLTTYRAADDKQREQLHRWFFVAVTKAILMRGASSDGRDGDTVAEQIDRLIPEEHALAEKQRTARLAYRMENIGTATRSEAENLAASFLARRQPERARQALVQWIKAHEQRLKADDGVAGLTRLADEYLVMLNDVPTAVELLKDAHKIDPGSEEVKTKLASLGYQWRGGYWARSDSIPREAQPAAKTLPTSISVGMTASDLRSLLGQPPSLTRAITARGVTEVWRFGAADSSGLVIRLEKRSIDSEPKVTALSGR